MTDWESNQNVQHYHPKKTNEANLSLFKEVSFRKVLSGKTRATIYCFYDQIINCSALPFTHKNFGWSIVNFSRLQQAWPLIQGCQCQLGKFLELWGCCMVTKRSDSLHSRKLPYPREEVIPAAWKWIGILRELQALPEGWQHDSILLDRKNGIISVFVISKSLPEWQTTYKMNILLATIANSHGSVSWQNGISA